MRTRITAILMILCLCPSHGADGAQESKAGSTPAKSLVFVEDGKTEKPKSVELLPSRSPLQNYVENLRRVSKWDVEDAKPDDPGNPFHPNNLAVTEIGPWYEYTVFDVTSALAKHKSILLKDGSGNFRILYCQFKFSMAELPLPSVVEIKGQKVLVYYSWISGTGNHHLEYYWTYDTTTKAPKLISLAPVESAVKKALPEGSYIEKGGGLDIQNLNFSNSVWKNGDGSASPTGGRIELKLDLRGSQLVVVETKYDPSATQ